MILQTALALATTNPGLSHGDFKLQFFQTAEFLLSQGQFNVHIRPDLVKDFSVPNIKHANHPIHSTGTNSLGKVLAPIQVSLPLRVFL